MQFIFITAPWWLNSKQSSKSNSKSKKGANAKQLFCKECLLGNRKYYTISNGMPSDIERHRKSKQHSEATITTVLSTSEEGHDLLERKRSATGAKNDHQTMNPSVCHHLSKLELMWKWKMWKKVNTHRIKEASQQMWKIHHKERTPKKEMVCS